MILADGLLPASGSFLPRLALLVLVLLLAALLELLLRGRRASRYREYSFLLAMGAFGAAVGAAIDGATSALSPEYFILGKGLSSGASLRGEALRLGAHAGFAAGCALSGTLLLLNRPRAELPAVPLSHLARNCGLIALAAIAGAGVLAAITSAFSLDLPFDPGHDLADSPRRRFALAWWTHLGAYLGALAGLLAQGRALRAARRASVD